MKFKIILIISLIFPLVASLSFALNDNNKNETDIEPKRIALLPFYNYSETSNKYLSDYIPELMAKHLKVYKGIMVYDHVTLQKEIIRRQLNAREFYTDKNALKFLKRIKTDIGISGRYIIQGNSIRIDFKVLFVDSGLVINGDDFKGIMDDYFLETIEKYSRENSEWIADNILINIVDKLDLKNKTQTKELVDRIRETKLGKMIENRWIFSGIIIISFLLLSKLLSYLLKKLLFKLMPFFHNAIDDKVSRKFRRTLSKIIVLFGIKIALNSMDLTPKTYDILNDITVGLIITLFAYIFIIIIRSLIHFWADDVKHTMYPRINRDLIPLFVTFTKITIVTICIIVILSRFNIDVGPFIASIGVLGIAIGFAVKDIMADIIGGVFIALDQSIAAGDTVRIDNDYGIIKEVGLRNTKLLTHDNEVIVIPNSELSSKKFMNYVLPDPSYRVIVKFSVAYGSDVDKVDRVVKEALKDVKDVQEYPAPNVCFMEMGEFSLNFEARFWIPNYDVKLIKKIEATKIIYNALISNDINIPFPTHTIYYKNE